MPTLGRVRDSRGVSPVIGVVLLVAITVLLAATVGVFATSFSDSQSEPQYSSVTIESVEKSDGDDIEIPMPAEDLCEFYHVAIRMEHQGGNSFDSGELEYLIEVSGDDGTTLSGRFNESVANPGVTARAGDEIVIGLDSDTSKANCDDSKSTVLFDGDLAWNPDEAGQVGDLYDIHDTFLEPETEELTTIRVRIVHLPSETILVDETERNIIDRSE